MYKIQTLNNIAKIGTDVFHAGQYTVGQDIGEPDGVLVRSMDMHEKPLPAGLKAIARAGAGTNNVPVDRCSEQGIVVFNTPGANANAVKELVLAGLLLSSRKIADGIIWTRGLAGQTGVAAMVEKGKSQFTGPELRGKKLGVVGLGAIGVLVANAAVSPAFGMKVYGFDPYLSVDAAWGLSSAVVKAWSMETIFATCDYVTIHIPLSDATKGVCNDELFKHISKSIRLLNFARAGLVDTAALKAALADGRISTYVTDFPTDELAGLDNVLALPHLGASTPESEDNCAYMAAVQLKEYLETGSIKNAVNFPDCPLEPTDKVRVAVLNRNVPNIAGPVAGVFAGRGINLDSMVNKSRGELAYTVLDVDGAAGPELLDEIRAIDGVLAVRVIQPELTQAESKGRSLWQS